MEELEVVKLKTSNRNDYKEKSVQQQLERAKEDLEKTREELRSTKKELTQERDRYAVSQNAGVSQVHFRQEKLINVTVNRKNEKQIRQLEYCWLYKMFMLKVFCAIYGGIFVL